MQGGATRRILLVEDNPGDADLVEELLSAGDRPEVQLQKAESLAAASRWLGEAKFDVVLLDLRLPDGSGMECVHAVRSWAPELPFVVLTGVDDGALALECLKAGAEDYLNKAELQARSLRRSIEYAIARSRERAAARRAHRVEALLATIVESSGDAIVSSTPEGLITSWNRGAELIFGYSKEEAIGKPVSMLLRTPDQEQSAERDQRFSQLRAGSLDPRPQDVVRIRKDGSLVHLSVVAADLHDDRGAIIGLAAISRDMTESRRDQAELLRRNIELERRGEQMRALAARLNAIREEERTRISREVHDELGQLLAGIKMDLRWITRRTAAGTESVTAGVVTKLAELERGTDRTIETVQRIALELRPSALDALGLPAALRDEARRFQARSGIKVEVDIEQATPPGRAVATELFRIFQELLTNIARHANASRARVVLKDEGGELVLHVEDDGVGMPTRAGPSRGSLGLLGMSERAESLGGQIEFMPGLAGGTVAILRVPMGEGG